MKKKRPSAMTAASLAIAALVLFLPSLLCLPPIIDYAQRFISRQFSVSLTVQSCSLGWWQGFSCENLRYQDPARGFRLTAPRLAGDKGLLLLLLAPQYLGAITAEQPQVTFFPLPAGVAGDERPAVGASSSEQAGRPAWWERLTCRFTVQKGLVEFDQGQNGCQEIAREIDLKGSLAVGTIDYALAFRSGSQQEGHLRAHGFINLPTARQSLFDSLISRTEVDIKDLELSGFLDLAASRSNLPRGRGVLAATGHVVTAGIKDFEVQGETSLRGLHLSGGFLGPDQPAIDQLLFTFKGSHNAATGWRLAALDLTSDPVRLEASGSYDHAVAALAAKGSVNLPVVAAQLPHLLSLHEQTRFREGTVDFSLDVTGTPQELELKAACRTGRLAVVHKGQSFFWDTPLSLVIEAGRRQDKTTVRILQAHTPFLEAQGSGSADDFSLQATANLGLMSEELRKLFALKYHANGSLTVAGSSKIQEDGRYQLATRIGINQLTLNRAGVPVLPSHDLLLTGAATARPAFFQDGGLSALRVETDFWPGKFSFSTQDSESEAGKSQTSCAASGELDLERLNNFFHGFTGTVPLVKWGGLFAFDGSGSWEDHRLSVQVLEGRMDRLAVSAGRYSHKEAQVTVSLANAIAVRPRSVVVRGLKVAENLEDFTEQERPIFLVDFQRQRLDLRHLNFNAAALRGRGSLLLGDWRQPHGEVVTEIQAESDAAFLVNPLKAADWFPENMTMKGQAQTTLKTRSGGEQELLTDLAVQVEPFELLRAKKKWFGAPRLSFNASVQGDLLGEGALKIPAFKLQTTPLQVAGTGLMQRGTHASLELQGTLAPDLQYFSRLLASGTGQKILLTGQTEGSFLYASPLKRPLALHEVTLSARLPVDLLRYRGLELRRLEFPVELNRGKLQVVIDGELSGGRVTLEPQMTLDARRTVMELPASSQILKDVVLQQPWVDRILGPLHPLFGALAKPKGTIDLRLDEFSWSRNEKGMQQPVFQATLGLGKVQFKPTKVLRELLDLNGIEDKTLQSKEQEVTCTGKEGLVSCKPVHLVAGGIEIGISGTVGKDRSLAYLLQMPVLSPLAGKVEQSLQVGVSVSVEIAGTLDAPVIDQEALLAAVTDQLIKAAVEKPPQPVAAESSGNEP